MTNGINLLIRFYIHTNPDVHPRLEALPHRHIATALADTVGKVLVPALGDDSFKV